MSIILRRQTHSENETLQLAALLAEQLRGGEIITLDGPLGAGKTCFVRGMARGLGIDPAEVSSPTFVLVHEYGLSATLPLLHIDGYRLHDRDELDTIGLEDLLSRDDAVVAIEWPSRLQDELASLERIEITFEHLGPNERRIDITASNSLADRLEHLRGETPETI